MNLFKQATFTKKVIAATIRIASGKSEFRGDYFIGIPVVVQDDFVISAGSMHAASGRDWFNRPTIFVTEEFFELPQHVKEFLIYHEFGHIHLGHIHEMTVKNMINNTLKNSVRNYRTLVGKVEQNELDADRFAAEQIGVGRAMMAMNWLAEDSIRIVGKGLHLREFKLRTDALLKDSK